MQYIVIIITQIKKEEVMPRIDTLILYSNAIKKHGVTPEGVCWHNEASQRIRFEIILSLLPKSLKDATLYDAGCGFGDFYHYLKEKNQLPKAYTGIDIHPQMCAIAKEKSLQNVIQADIIYDELPVCDYYIASGSLNLLTTFEAVLCIQNLYKSSKKGLIFNVLCSKSSSQTYNYMAKEQLQTIAKELHVAKYRFKEGYLRDDISIAFYR